MKKIFLTSFVLLFTLTVFSQKKQKTTIEPIPLHETKAYKIQQDVFKTSLGYGDYGVAKNALYEMIAIDSENDGLKDTLAILYFQANDPSGCVLVSNEILEKYPEKVAVRNLRAISFNALGMFKEALADYELLYKDTGELEHLYQIATIQYEMKRFGECANSLQTILSNEKADQLTVSISTKQSRQKVPMKAAAFNINGVMLMEMGKEKEAKEAFEKALAIMPDFQLAVNNLEVIKSKEE